MSTRILVLTDSLALPRTFPEICPYERTWPIILKNQGYNVHQVSIGGATSTDLLRQLSYHEAFNPDVIIVQVGIVDCAPRFMSKAEQSLALRIPYFGKKLIALMNNASIKKLRKIKYVTNSAFQNNIQSIAKKFEGKRFVIIGILPALPQYEIILPGVTSNVAEFNSILKKYENFIDVSDISSNCIMSDLHHLNQDGHRYIAGKLLAKLHKL